MVDKLRDARADAYSILITITHHDCLDLVRLALDSVGKSLWEGAADLLHWRSHQETRATMVQDLIQGALLPPLVIGALLSEAQLTEALLLDTDFAYLLFLQSLSKGNIVILDGLQRAVALLYAVDKDSSTALYRTRTELWLTSNANSLVYRSLVLQKRKHDQVKCTDATAKFTANITIC